MRTWLLKFVLTCLALILSPVTVAGEKPLTASHEDSSLQWSACPALFPEGCQIAVLHGHPAEPNADIYFKIPGGYEFPAHWHTSAERMVVVSGELDVTYEGQETVHLETGMYAYGPAQAVHHGKCVRQEQCVLVIAFEEPVDAYRQEDSQ